MKKKLSQLRGKGKDGTKGHEKSESKEAEHEEHEKGGYEEDKSEGKKK